LPVPNNYRFIDRPEYRPVSDKQLADARIQQRTAEFLRGKNNENIYVRHISVA